MHNKPERRKCMKKSKILFFLIFTTACISAQSVEISMKLHEGETYSSRISSFALSNMEFGEEQLNVITYYSSDIQRVMPTSEDFISLKQQMEN